MPKRRTSWRFASAAGKTSPENQPLQERALKLAPARARAWSWAGNAKGTRELPEFPPGLFGDLNEVALQESTEGLFETRRGPQPIGSRFLGISLPSGSFVASSPVGGNACMKVSFWGSLISGMLLLDVGRRSGKPKTCFEGPEIVWEEAMCAVEKQLASILELGEEAWARKEL